MKAHVSALLVLLSLLAAPGLLRGQEGPNLELPPDSLERLLRYGSFEVTSFEENRFRGDRTHRAVLDFRDGPRVKVKWARAPRGGDAFNNHPRYELASYELQKLFLDPGEYVVPPTAVRCLPLWRVKGLDPGAGPTFGDHPFAVTVLQYWLSNVAGGEDLFYEGRVRWDTAYARRVGNLNVFTYLADHKDNNRGNVMMSKDARQPRMFAVDNGLTFGSDESDRGDEWRHLRVDRLPRSTVQRLREVTLEDLERTLGVVAQFERRGSEMVLVPPTGNLAPGKGIRRKDGVWQLGLTRREIRDVHARLQKLLEKVDRGEIATF